MVRKNGGGAQAWRYLLLAIAAAAPIACHARAARPAQCERLELAGEVNAGHEWRAAFGEGWVFRLLPIAPGRTGDAYSGWDLVVDREHPAGYPDALLLATPPYNSINEREVGTTYRLRAQDAIGWNPRSFHFLTAPAALREGQSLYIELSRDGRSQPSSAAGADSPESRATRKLMALQDSASAGEFRILDARLVPGSADAVSYAENWALQSEKTPYSVESMMGSHPTPRGELFWIKFSITLWLPNGWKPPKTVKATPASCGQRL